MDYTRDFDQYFNHLLRDTLNYPERFTIKSSNSSIILIPDSPSKLLELIKTNPDIKRKIISQILTGLQDKDNNITNVYFSTHGTDIVVEIESLNKFLTLDVGVYANIASDFDTQEELESFCRSTKRIREVCGLSSFWSELLKQKFPQYFIEDIKGYNWEKVYKGLLWLHNEFKFREETFRKYGIKNTDELRFFFQGIQVYSADVRNFKFRILNMWFDLRIKYRETFYYLVLNKLNLFKEYLNDIVDPLLNFKDDDLILYILNNYTLNLETLQHIVEYYFQNIPIMRLIIKQLEQYKDIDVKFIMEHILREVLHNNDIKLSLDEFKFYFNYLYPNGTSEYMFLFLSETNKFDDNTVNYVVSQLPDDLDPDTVVDYIIGFTSDLNLVEALWKKYKHMLQDRKEDILNSIVAINYEDKMKLIRILDS